VSFSPLALPSAGLPLMLQSLACDGLHDVSNETGPAFLGPSFLALASRAFEATRVGPDNAQRALLDLLQAWDSPGTAFAASGCLPLMAQKDGLVFPSQQGYDDQAALRASLRCGCNVVSDTGLQANLFRLLAKAQSDPLAIAAQGLGAYLNADLQAQGLGNLSGTTQATLDRLLPVVLAIVTDSRFTAIQYDTVAAMSPAEAMAFFLCPYHATYSLDDEGEEGGFDGSVANVRRKGPMRKGAHGCDRERPCDGLRSSGSFALRPDG
jgi:hypothetical protein